MGETNFGSFTNYKQTVMDITGDLKKMREFSQRMNLEGNVSMIDDVLSRLAADTFSVAIVGEFKRGKSTLINALLEKDVLPTDVVPTTATLNKVTYSVTPFVRIEYNDGKTEDIEIDRLSDYVTKLTPESEAVASTVKIATVYYPVNYCKNGVTIIDTPGLNDNEAMTEVTLSVLPQIDAAIMVMMAGSPFSQYECEFLENKVIASDLGRVLFVVTGIDLYDDEDAEKVLRVIKTRIQESIMQKAKKVYGEGSKEYETYRRKLGAIRIYGISAKQALKAKKKNDPELLERSCFPQFEQALETFLTEDRGAVMLNVPLTRIKTSSVELLKAVQLRENALTMQKEEFNEKYEQAMEEIDAIRTQRREEFRRLSDAADRTYQELLPSIREYWSRTEQAAMQAVEEFPISDLSQIQGPQAADTQEQMTQAVAQAMEQVGQEISERIQAAISSALEDEADRMSGFEKYFFESTEKIHGLFASASSGAGGGDMVVSVIASSILGFGLGGIYLGYREAGWKGALLGGGTSFAGAMATSLGVGLLTAALAIPVTWPVLLVGGVVAATVGTFTGKWVLGKAFKKDKIASFKSSFQDAVSQEIQRMRAEDSFSDNVRSQITAAFDTLKEKIRTETEAVLNDTQNQLTQLKVELAQANSMEDREKTELKQMLQEVDAICQRADTLNQQLTAVLTRGAEA